MPAHRETIDRSRTDTMGHGDPASWAAGRGDSTGRFRPRRRRAKGMSLPLRMVLLAVGAILFLIGLTRPALAWGRMGHRASARLAESRLSPRAKAMIRDLLEPGDSAVTTNGPIYHWPPIASPARASGWLSS